MPDVDVATIVPQAVDTPIFELAANYSGRAVRPIPPVVDPEEVAHGILLCARSPKREVTYSRMGRLLEVAQSLLPGLYSRFLPPGARPTAPAVDGDASSGPAHCGAADVWVE